MKLRSHNIDTVLNKSSGRPKTQMGRTHSPKPSVFAHRTATSVCVLLLFFRVFSSSFARGSDRFGFSLRLIFGQSR